VVPRAGSAAAIAASAASTRSDARRSTPPGDAGRAFQQLGGDRRRTSGQRQPSRVGESSGNGVVAPVDRGGQVHRSFHRIVDQSGEDAAQGAPFHRWHVAVRRRCEQRVGSAEAVALGDQDAQAARFVDGRAAFRTDRAVYQAEPRVR
jgi:hypothetical protein